YPTGLGSQTYTDGKVFRTSFKTGRSWSATWWMEERSFNKNSPAISRGENGKFRNHHAMTIVGVPDVDVREAIDVRLEVADGVHEHEGHEEFLTNLEEEERAIPVLAKPVAISPNKLNDLGLCQAKLVQIISQTTEDGPEI